ncbi:hypothetical protein V6N13_001475 [Hibiscus sabdariffa]
MKNGDISKRVMEKFVEFQLEVLSDNNAMDLMANTKIVSLVTAGGDSVSGVDGKPMTEVGDAIDKLRLMIGVFESEKQVECVEESYENGVDQFEVGEVEGFESEREVEFMQETNKKVDDL